MTNKGKGSVVGNNQKSTDLRSKFHSVSFFSTKTLISSSRKIFSTIISFFSNGTALENISHSPKKRSWQKQINPMENKEMAKAFDKVCHDC